LPPKVLGIIPIRRTEVQRRGDQVCAATIHQPYLNTNSLGRRILVPGRADAVDPGERPIFPERRDLARDWRKKARADPQTQEQAAQSYGYAHWRDGQGC